MSRRAFLPWILVVAAAVPIVCVLALSLLAREPRFGVTAGVPMTVTLSRAILLLGFAVEVVIFFVALALLNAHKLRLLVFVLVAFLSVGFIYWATPFVWGLFS